MLRAGLAGGHSRNRNSRSPVMQKHLCQTLLFTLVETYGAWRVGVVAPLDAARAESRGGCLWGNRGRAGNGAASQKGPTNTMSALHPIATANAKFRKRHCLLD